MPLRRLHIVERHLVDRRPRPRRAGDAADGLQRLAMALGVAGGQHADLFLSLHHDSAQLRYLEKIVVDGRDAYRTTKPIQGYSLFVSRINPQFAKSYRFAALLGNEMRAMGRTPSPHHA